QRAEVAAADAPALRRLHHAALDGLDRALVAAVAAAAEALGELQDSIAAPARLEPTLDSHCSLLLRQAVLKGPLTVVFFAPREDQRIVQPGLPLAVFAQRQVVAAAGLAGLDLAGPGHAEPLHRAALRLQLRHLGIPLVSLRAAPSTRTSAIDQAFG